MDKEARQKLLAMPFRLTIEDVFVIYGRPDVVVIGRVAAGRLREGARVRIVGNDKSVEATAASFELFGYIDVIEAGDNIGIRLTGIRPEDVEVGMVVTNDT